MQKVNKLRISVSKQRKSTKVLILENNRSIVSPNRYDYKLYKTAWKGVLGKQLCNMGTAIFPVVRAHKFVSLHSALLGSPLFLIRERVYALTGGWVPAPRVTRSALLWPNSRNLLALCLKLTSKSYLLGRHVFLFWYLSQNASWLELYVNFAQQILTFVL